MHQNWHLSQTAINLPVVCNLKWLKLVIICDVFVIKAQLTVINQPKPQLRCHQHKSLIWLYSYLKSRLSSGHIIFQLNQHSAATTSLFVWEFLNFSLESDILVRLWMSAESFGTKLSPVSYFRIQQEVTSQRHETCLGGTDQLRSTATCCQFVCVNAYIICRPLQMSLKLIAVSLSTDCNCW